MKLKFSTQSRPTKANPELQRRERLVHRIDQQIGHVRTMIGGGQPKGAWVWMGETRPRISLPNYACFRDIADTTLVSALDAKVDIRNTDSLARNRPKADVLALNKSTLKLTCHVHVRSLKNVQIFE